MADFEQMRKAIGHDPCRASDRAPSGAVPARTTIRFALRVHDEARASVSAAFMLIGGSNSADSSFAWAERQLDASNEGFAIALEFPEVRVLYYAFHLVFSNETDAYLVPCRDGRSSAGELVRNGIDGEWTERGWAFAEDRLPKRPREAFNLDNPTPGFQVTVYEPQFHTPSWMHGAIMYQIFPDRFSQGDGGVRDAGIDHHARMKRPVHMHERWDEAAEWGTTDYDPIDFFGGTLEGIRQNLGYLQSLGVEALYLNPIFEARSNHRYDTADYEHVDALLGSDDDFARLADEAANLGIHVVLDAVLSHTGNDSRYFNALGTYDEPGAFQGPHSPFYPWFDFDDESSGAGYRCWWGFPTLPEVDERNPAWQDYILGAEGVLARWLKTGASGYRLDVADEIPDDVLEKIRGRVKATKADAAVIGEVWEDATTKESYGVPRTYALGASLDSVMNYPLRTALLGFALGSIDAHQLSTFLRMQQANYPAPLYGSLMNLLSSHDVERLRSVLSLGKPLKQLSREEQVEAVTEITDEQDKRGACLQRLVVALLYALPGMPCTYYGDELGLQGGGDPFCRASFPQTKEAAAKRADCGENLVDFYRELGAVRKNSPALRSGALACTAPDSDILCIMRANEGEDALAVVAVNRSNRARTVAFDTDSPDFGLSQNVHAALHTAKCHVKPLFQSASENKPETPGTCEHGIIKLAIPPCATVYWTLSLNAE